MRASGLLLPISSLPDGGLGRDAFRFVDFLAEAKQRWWQVLPVGPPGCGGSPYAALSAFAGNEAWIEDDGAPPDGAFRRRNAFWLRDYARFRALRARFRGAPWNKWPKRLPDVGAAARRYEARQFAFERRWLELKRYANGRGVGLIGDVPFFVAHDSADVWAHPELFKLAPSGAPRVVAGVPPDYFSADGQLWGNPHYRWRAAFRWWSARMRRAFDLFDMVRLDHFLGFVRAWEVSARARTARRGKWVAGPGAKLFSHLRRSLGRRPMIAEDLGLVTPKADALRRRFGLPGMRVLHFCFSDDPALRPHHFPRDCVVYTGTHDNDTTVGWYRKAGADGQRARRYAGCRAREIHWGLIRVAHLSVADLAIVPVQDVLGLDSRARVNRPGTTRGNWKWKLRRGQLRRTHARKLGEITELAGR